jgi:phosphate transport system protein
MPFRSGTRRRGGSAGSEAAHRGAPSGGEPTPTADEGGDDQGDGGTVIALIGVGDPVGRPSDHPSRGAFGADPHGLPAGSTPTLVEIDRIFVQVFALVGEALAGATHALLAGDRDAAKQLVARDEIVDQLTHRIADQAQQRLVDGDTTPGERRELVAVLRMLPDLERNGDLAEHIARRAARGLGAEMSARSRGLVERMGEVATNIWRCTADAFAERSVVGASYVDDLDDELDDLHVTLTAELVAGTMPLPVAIELAMVARFYERFGDHAVNLARRMAALVVGGPEPGASGPD